MQLSGAALHYETKSIIYQFEIVEAKRHVEEMVDVDEQEEEVEGLGGLRNLGGLVPPRSVDPPQRGLDAVVAAAPHEARQDREDVALRVLLKLREEFGADVGDFAVAPFRGVRFPTLWVHRPVDGLGYVLVPERIRKMTWYM